MGEGGEEFLPRWDCATKRPLFRFFLFLVSLQTKASVQPNGGQNPLPDPGQRSTRWQGRPHCPKVQQKTPWAKPQKGTRKVPIWQRGDALGLHPFIDLTNVKVLT